MSAQKPLQLLKIILSCGTVLVLVSVLSGCSKRTAPQPPATLPTPAAPNESILYVSGGTLYLTDLSGTSVRRLTGAGGGDWFPDVSPDSSQVAFWSNASGAFELWVLDLVTGNRRQLTDFNERVLPAELRNFGVHNSPSWSPDGKRLVFAFDGKIWMIESTGFNLETVIAEGENYSPAWSPDGNELVFVSVRGRTRNLYLRRFGTDEDWPLTNFPARQQVGGPAWSADGQWLAFTVSTEESSDIWTLRSDGTQLRRITQDRVSHSPAWSRDGRRLAFASGRQDPSRWEIWVMNPDGSGAFTVSRNGGVSPAWLRAPRTGVLLSSGPSAPAPTVGTVPRMATPAPARILSPSVPPRARTTLPAGPIVAPTVRPAPPTQVPSRPATARPTSAPTLRPTAVPAKPALGEAKPASVEAKPTTRPTIRALPTASKEDYSQYESYAEQDRGVLPQLDISEDLQTHRISYTPQLEFHFAKDLLKPSSFPVLKQLAEELNKSPESPLVVQGQISGGAKLFRPLLKSLSRARANSVLRHLIVTEKIKHINVNTMGEGDEFPELGKRPKNEPLLIVIVK